MQASRAQPAPVARASPEAPPARTPNLTADSAVRYALENNPQLVAARQQYGMAAGAVVIADTYPYNPVAQVGPLAAFGPDVTNSVLQAFKVSIDVEYRGQRGYRRQAASAAMTRTEWEIAAQELALAVSTARAFNAVLYRQRKLQVLQDTVQLNEQVVDQVQKLVDLGRFRPADLIVARTELDAARAQLGQGKTALAMARADLRRQLGTLDDSFAVTGELDLPVPAADADEYTQAALARRPDVQARKAAVAEAQARLRLQEADRYGNPNIGPVYEYNESRVNFIGVQVSGPIPIFNSRRGEILQAQTVVARSLAEVRQFEIQSAQDVQAALARLAAAQKWSGSYTAEVLPKLQQAVKDMNKLLEQNDPGVDVLKVIGVQRNYLRAFDNYLDALFELSQSRADLGAAVADPGLALGLHAPRPAPDPNAEHSPGKDRP
jgi:cobalt-zinc-cadmium efflux system outer membrane protein